MNSNATWGSDEQNPYASPRIATAGPNPIAAAALSQLQGTRRGLQLVYYGIVLILLAMVLLIFAMIILAAVGNGPGGPPVEGVTTGVLVVFAMAVFVGSIVIFVGQCFCLSVPPASQAKGLITVSVSLQALNLLLGGGLAIASFSITPLNPDVPISLASLARLISLVIGLVAFFCFLAFIKRVARFINRRDQSEFAGKVIAVFASLIGLYVLMFVGVIAMAFGAGPRGPGGQGGFAAFGLTAGCFGLVILVVAIVGLCMYTTLLRNVIKAIQEQMQAAVGQATVRQPATDSWS